MAPAKPKQRTLGEAIRALKASPLDRKLLGEVVGLSLPYVEQGVQEMLGPVADDPQALAQYDQIVEEFLAKKFADPKFIVYLLERDAPGPTVATAAYNFAASFFRPTGLPRDTQGLEPRQGDERDGRGAAGHADPRPGHDELALAVERAAAMRRILDELPIDERVLLKVLLACDGDLDDEEVQFLADRRGVAPEVVRQEITARGARTEERERELEMSVDKRASYISELHERRHRFVRIIAEKDGEPMPRVAPGLLQLYVSDGTIRGATPEWRSGQLAALDARIAQWEPLLKQDYDKLADPLHGRPNYQEVALLLGYVRVADGAERIKTAANTVQVESKRFLAKAGRRFRDREEG
jgi:hypothetical protein